MVLNPLSITSSSLTAGRYETHPFTEVFIDFLVVLSFPDTLEIARQKEKPLFYINLLDNMFQTFYVY